MGVPILDLVVRLLSVWTVLFTANLAIPMVESALDFGLEISGAQVVPTAPLVFDMFGIEMAVLFSRMVVLIWWCEEVFTDLSLMVGMLVVLFSNALMVLEGEPPGAIE